MLQPLQVRVKRARDDAGDPDATLHAMAGEILKCRRALSLLAKAVDWAKAGAPFAVVPPGPYWQPQQQSGASESSEPFDAAPASA